MPFKSKAQRRKFYAMAARGEISKAKVKEWERETPKKKALPEKVKEAHAHGAADALDVLGFKTAAKELRLKLKQREYHGYGGAMKRAEEGLDADSLADVLGILPGGLGEAEDVATDPLERPTAWGGPTNPAGGDTASRVSDLGLPTSAGKAY